MKILVIDDSVANQESAKSQLAEHDLTVVSTYDDGLELVRDKDLKCHFDVVLADLLMPASSRQINPNGKGVHLIGQEMPVGIFLALSAATNGAKYVAVLTDSSHHAHPASACLDAFYGYGEAKPVPFTVGGAVMLLSNTRAWVDEVGENQPVRAKNWKKLLDYLITPHSFEGVRRVY